MAADAVAVTRVNASTLAAWVMLLSEPVRHLTPEQNNAIGREMNRVCGFDDKPDPWWFA